jgi:hypothetical protein
VNHLREEQAESIIDTQTNLSEDLGCLAVQLFVHDNGS